jgi:hypothetical protein
MKNKNQEPILIGIKRIKDISFSIFEEKIIPDPNRMIKIEFQNTVSFNTDMDILNFTFRVYYHYENESVENILLDAKVQNIFAIPNLKRFLKSPTHLDLPDGLVQALTAMTIAHTRAMVAKNSAGTMLQDVLIPIVNVADVASFFFPKNFHEQPDHAPIQTPYQRAKAKNS